MECTSKSMRAEVFAGLGEDAVDGRVIGDVALFDKWAADAGGQRIDSLLQHLAGIGEAQLCAFFVQRLGDAPGNRVLVGNTKDQPLFSFEKTHLFLL